MPNIRIEQGAEVLTALMTYLLSEIKRPVAGEKLLE